MAFSLSDIQTYANNPTSIPAPGQYGQGQISNIQQMLQTMKDAVKNGQMSVTDYSKYSGPLISQAFQAATTIGGQGSAAASTVVPLWNQMQQSNFWTYQGGKVIASLPFSQQEYAALPSNVLPTQTDINNGTFNPTLAPLQRYQTPGGGTTNTPGTGVTPTPVNGPNGQPLPQINPSLPPGTNTQTDQGQIALQGANNAASLQDALNKQLQVNQQAVGQLGQSISSIPGMYTAEGAAQQQQLQALADQQKSARAQALTDLGTTLAQNQQNLFNQSIPDLAEQANTSGMYRSTGFGNILAQKYANLTQNTQSALALQGISDRDAYLQAQQQALGANLGYQGQATQAQATGAQTIGSANAGALQAYGAGLGDVANVQIGMQNAGLQRQFSLQDYATQYANALNLANQAKTQGPTGKASPGTQAALGSISTIANPAAALYGASGGKTSSPSQAIGMGMSPQFGSVGTPTYL